MKRLRAILVLLLLLPPACGGGAPQLASLRTPAGHPIRHVQVDASAVRNPHLLPGRPRLVATSCARLRALGGEFACGAEPGRGEGRAILLLDVMGYESLDVSSRIIICVSGRLTFWDAATRRLLWSGGRGLGEFGGVCAAEVRRLEEDLGDRAWEEFLGRALPLP